MFRIISLFFLIFINITSYAMDGLGHNYPEVDKAGKRKAPGSEIAFEKSTKSLKSFLESFPTTEQKDRLSVTDVARIILILDKKEREKNSEIVPIDKLKLHKLCYYSNGFVLGLTGQPLFMDPTYAYTHGPYYGGVVNVLYDECELGCHTYPYHLKWAGPDDDLSSYDQDSVAAIKNAYQLKRSLTGKQLERDTHEEKPWKETYKPDMKYTLIREDLLKDFFSEPQQVSGYLKKSLEHATVPQFVKLLLQTKKWIGQIHNIKQIISLNDYLLDVLVARSLNDVARSLNDVEKKELIKVLSNSIDELINPLQENFTKALAGYLFFPRELTDGYTPLQTSFLNLTLHRKLAYAAKYGHPVAQEFCARLLKNCELDDADVKFTSKALKKQSRDTYVNIAESAQVPFYYRGLAYKFLGLEEEAKKQFQNKDETQDHAFSLYELAVMKESNRENDVFETYEKSYGSQYLKALLGMGANASDDDNAFHYFIMAGESGLGEGYFQAAKMIKEGRQQEHPYQTYLDLLKLAAKNDSISALFTLGEFYEKKGDRKTAIHFYQALANKGNVQGFLEWGRILVNRQSYDKAAEVYRHENAGWSGLYALAKISVYVEESKIKAEATEKIKLHYKELIKIATDRDEVDADA